MNNNLINNIFNIINNNNYKNINNTINKYILYLIGPPASGKTLGKYIGFYKIQQLFNENINIEETFITINIDDITYETIIDNITIINKLKNEKDKILKKYNIDNNQDSNIILNIINDNVNKIEILENFLKSTKNLYVKNREMKLIYIILYLASILNKNIILESATIKYEYYNQILYFLKNYYNYIPIFIYPYTYNTNILYNRSLLRGLKEGRFLSCEYLNDNVKNNIINYNKIVSNHKLFIDNYKQIVIFRYDTLITIEEYNEFMKNKNYDIIKKYELYQYYKKYDKENLFIEEKEINPENKLIKDEVLLCNENIIIYDNND